MGSTCASVWPLALIVSLFFLWGAANSLNDILIRQFTKAFALKDWQAGLVQSAFYVGYFFGALPAAKVASEHGYKAAVMVGLCLFSSGSCFFYVASRGGGSYGGFLCCLYLVAFGLAFLEASANPWVKLLGDAVRPGSGAVALNVAQTFNPFGSLLGVACGRWFILDGREPPPDATPEYYALQAAAVGPLYLAVALVVASVLLAFGCTRFPELPSYSSGKDKVGLSWAKLRQVGASLSRNAAFLRGTAAQFFYVAAQVSVWSFVIRLVQASVPGTDEKAASGYITASLCLFSIGRFAASALLCLVEARKLLVMYSLGALGCTVAVAFGHDRFAVLSLCGISFFMSMMYPTIFALAIAAVEEADREVASSVLVMAIVGGAAAPPAMGALSDASSISRAYLLPAFCFFVVACYGFVPGGCSSREAEYAPPDAAAAQTASAPEATAYGQSTSERH